MNKLYNATDFERGPADFYPTPPDLTRGLIDGVVPPRLIGCSVRKGVPVNFKTRPLSNPTECAEALGDILAAIGRGDLCR